MSRFKRNGMLVAGTLALLGMVAPAEAQRVKVGEERQYEAATPAMYPRGAAHRPAVWSETVVSPGAKFLRIHFTNMNLPEGDYISISSPEADQFWTYSGRGPQGTGEFWSFGIEADIVVVELHAGPRRFPRSEASSFGVGIDRIAHGTAPMWGGTDPQTQIVCGTDGRKNAACYTNVNTRPVARLSFQSGGSSYVCTGWLVAGSSSSTLITNNHCFDTQSETSTVQARFNYQTTTCTGTTTASYTTYAGGTFLQTSASLDFTLITLQGNPEATWGEYTATTKTPTVAMAINFPQHPGGGLKKVGYWKDSAGTQRCDVAGANVTVSGYSSSSQMTYSCDSEGGSSGSPIMDAGTGRIIGLHHLGGVGGSTCLNSATQMKNVCAAAGTRLTCSST